MRVAFLMHTVLTNLCRLEVEISTIRQQLDQITKVLTSRSTPLPVRRDDGTRDEFYERSPPKKFPFLTLQTSSVMEFLGVKADIAKYLVNMERLNTSDLTCVGGSRFFVLQHQKALR